VLQPVEYERLLDYGIGLADIVKNVYGNDDVLSRDSFDVQGLRRKIEKYAPKAVAFNGKWAAKIFLGRREVEYGVQAETVGTTVLFVLPSTSGATRGHWDERHWADLAKHVG